MFDEGMEWEEDMDSVGKEFGNARKNTKRKLLCERYQQF